MYFDRYISYDTPSQVDEVTMVPEEVVTEVPVEVVQEKYVTQKQLMPTVKAKYSFDGQGMKMAKGEVSQLTYGGIISNSWKLLSTF